MQPGDYAIPTEITRSLAKCAVADGAGEIVEMKPFRAAKKGPAPENKLAAPAPETKLADGNRGGDGTKPDAGPRKSRARTKVDRGQ
jgi:hypothetical protein